MKTITTLLALSAVLSVPSVAQYSIVPSSVSLGTRQQWCLQQQEQCPLICLQTPTNSAETIANTCDPYALTYSCVCSNGLSPNLTEYSQTLPYFICTEWGTQCVSNCGIDNSCASACRQQHPCGASDPKLANTSTLTTATHKGQHHKTATTELPLTLTSASGTAVQVCTGFGPGGCAAATPTASTGDGSKHAGKAKTSNSAAVARWKFHNHPSAWFHEEQHLVGFVMLVTAAVFGLAMAL